MKELSDFTVLIVGLGQIGGSIAKALVSRRIVQQVFGFDTSPAVIEKGLMREVIDKATDPADAITGADLIILATPAPEIVIFLEKYQRQLRARPSITILDVAGTKRQILERAEQLGLSEQFIGGHPLAGTEKRGIDAAELELFRNRTFVLIPASAVSPERLHRVQQLAESLGALPYTLSASEHDELISLTISLPHAVSLALVELITEKTESERQKVDPLIGGSFTGVTRVAVSPKHLLLDLLLANNTLVANSLLQLIKNLQKLQRMVSDNDRGALSNLIDRVHDVALKVRERERL
jgi:prephenate dehydrogenase